MYGNPVYPFILFFLVNLTFLQAQENKILLIGIDGCRPDALAIAETPNIDEIKNNGFYSPHALNDDITVTGPGWSAIFCGVWSDKHLVTGNDFADNNFQEYPTIFKRIEDHNPEIHTASFVQWSPLNELLIAGAADHEVHLDSEMELTNATVDYLENNDPDLLFLYFDSVDDAGHSDGFSPQEPAYIDAIESVDTKIGIVYEALLARPNYDNENWLILISTDHGGIGTDHGGHSPEEEEVFFIANGGELPPSEVLKDSALIDDTPDNCLGDTLELYFDGVDDYLQVGANTLFDFGENQDFTIECRVRTALAADVAIVGNKDWDYGLNTGFVFSFRYDSGPEWKVNIADGSNRSDINIGGTIADNEWHTLSVSFDRDGVMKMYEDGQFIAEEDISEIGNINTNAGLFFGADINGKYPYQGAIAEVRVWDIIVNDQAINNWACSTVYDVHPDWNNLIGYWKMNEGAGATIPDQINNNAGIINGANWTGYDSIYIYDYNQTPRLTDFAVTALTHFCIPIDPAWNLDGASIIDLCQPNSIFEASNNTNPQLLIAPNPIQDIFNIELKNTTLDKGLQLKIYDATGNIVNEKTLKSLIHEMDFSTHSAGLYWLILEKDEVPFLTEKIIKI